MNNWLTADSLDDAILTLVRETDYPFAKLQFTRLDWEKQITVSVDAQTLTPAAYLDDFPGAAFYKIKVDGDRALRPEIFAHDRAGRLIGVLTQVEPFHDELQLRRHLGLKILDSTLDEYHRVLLTGLLAIQVRRYFKATTRKERNRLLDAMYRRIPT